MRWSVRLARACDIDGLYDLACLAGPGLTNLPADKDSLAARLAWSERSYRKELSGPEDELYMFVLEESESGRIGGTAAILSSVGRTNPFYSYRLSRLSSSSIGLGCSRSTDVLNLVNDFDGSAEVGGLFLHPGLRGLGLGALLATSRYLFIRRHRERFPERILSELRGVSTPDGSSPFWHAVGERFFGISFAEADRLSGVTGSSFIGELMPKLPIYVSLLPDSARHVIGRPHPAGVPALEMLQLEGLRYDGYVDIFDAGPTLSARIDDIRSIARAADVERVERRDQRAADLVVSGGDVAEFRACPGALVGADSVAISSQAPIFASDHITYVQL